MKEIKKQDLENLSLLSLYLSSWNESIEKDEEPILKAWKNTRFEILDSLKEKGLISDSRGSKSIFLTKEGIKKAEKLKNQFLKTEKEDETEELHKMAIVLSPLVKLVEIGLEKNMTSQELAKYIVNVFKGVYKEMEKIEDFEDVS